MHVSITPRSVTRALCAAVVLLTIAGTGAVVGYHLFDHYSGNHYAERVASLFNLNGEANIPAWFSSGLLLFSALASGIIALARRAKGERDALYWAGLAVIFTCLSIDETVGMHEMLNQVVRGALKTDGAFRFAWIIPALLFVSVFGGCYLGFLARLPAKTRWAFVVAGMMFVSGAVGLEMLEGHLQSRGLEPTFGYGMILVAEEFLEMIAIVRFLHAQLDYIAEHLPAFALRVNPSPAASRAAAAVDIAPQHA
jgi:hypothetical protein